MVPLLSQFLSKLSYRKLENPSNPLPPCRYSLKKIICASAFASIILTITLIYILVPNDIYLPLRPLPVFHPYQPLDNPPPLPRFPPYIHMTLKDKYNPTPDVLRNINSWRRYNPEYAVILYDDDDMREMVRIYRPDLLLVYDRLEHIVERADFWRYLVIWVFGGVYADSDVECMQSIRYWNDQFLRPPNSTIPARWTPAANNTSPSLQSKDMQIASESRASTQEDIYNRWIPSVIVGIEDHYDTAEEVEAAVFTANTQFLQWTFAGVRHHPLFDHMLRNIASWVEDERMGRRVSSGNRNLDILLRTGPGVFTRTIAKWLADRGWTPEEAMLGYPVVDGVGVLEESAFSFKGDLYEDNPQSILIMHHFKGSWK